jgi:hypothetical protein
MSLLLERSGRDCGADVGLFVTDGDIPRSCVRWAYRGAWRVEVEPNGSGVGCKTRTAGACAGPVRRAGVNTDGVGELIADANPLAFPSR